MRKVLSRTSCPPIFFGLVLAALVGGAQPQRERAAIIRRKGNTVTVKVDPKTGSPGMAMATQALEPGVGIPVHMHEHADEVLFVHAGRGVAVLGGQKKEMGKGDTVFVPRGVWHGVESCGEAVDLLWVVTPPGLEGYFRETGVTPGAPPKALTPAQLDDIGRKHGVRFKH